MQAWPPNRSCRLRRYRRGIVRSGKVCLPSYECGEAHVRQSIEPALGRISLFGVSVLIVEDEPLIALDLHAALSAAGAGIIAATDTDEALRLIRRNDVSAAVLDISLGERDCTAVCQALLHHRVPFLFHTGHAKARLLQAWPQVPVLIKPVSHQEIVSCLGKQALSSATCENFVWPTNLIAMDGSAIALSPTGNPVAMERDW
jgi:CheY-like chemotaxis protein